MSQDRPIWLAIFIITSLLAAAGAGFITWLISKNVGKAILTGASAFGGTVVLFMAMAAFVLSGPTGTPANSGSNPTQSNSGEATEPKEVSGRVGAGGLGRT